MRSLLFALLLVGLPVSAMAQTRVDLDRVESVSLDENGEARIRVEVPRTGILRADLFSAPAEVGNVSVEFLQDPPAEGEAAPAAVPVNSRAVEKGRQTLVVRTEGGAAGDIQLRLMLDPVLDLYEPNNLLADAMPVEAPFLGLVRVSAGDEDWFRVNAPRGHLVGVHLRTRSAYTGPVISFHDRDGEVLYASSNDQWGHRGMRYYRSDGQPIFVKVIDTYNWRADDVGAFRQLAIETFEPDRESANVFVKIDMGAVEGASNQIDFVGEAAGTRVASAEEATEIAEELSRAVRDEGGSGSGVLGWFAVLLIVALGGGGVYFLRRSKAD